MELFPTDSLKRPLLPLESSDLVTKEINTLQEFEEFENFVGRQRERIDNNLTLANTLNDYTTCGTVIQEVMDACVRCLPKFPAIAPTLEDYKMSKRFYELRLSDFSK